MNFDLTDEQVQLQRTVAEVVADWRSRNYPRLGEVSIEGFSSEIVKGLNDLGLAELIVPMALGGAGLSLYELALVAEQLGRGAISSPLLAQAWGPQTLLAHATSERAHELALGIVGGSSTATWAHLEPTMHDEWSSLQCKVTPHESGYRLNGVKILVPYAGSSTEMLVSALAADDDLWLCVVGLTNDGVVLTREHATGGEPMYRIDLSDAFITEESVLLKGEQASAAVAASLDAGTVIELAFGMGLSAEALRMTTEYAKERHQFGQPIGAFQAIAHRCADMLVDLEGARVLVFRAVWAITQGISTDEVAVAKAFADGAISRIFVNAHQVHGAIGFSTEYDLQMFTRRAKAVELGFGIVHRHLTRVASFFEVA